MTDRQKSEHGRIGYKSPPRSTRFQKGRSGNPRGRPKGSKRGLPFDHVLGQMVTVHEGNRERRVTAAEAFLLHLTKKALEGDGPSMRAILEVLDRIPSRADREGSLPKILRIVFRGSGVGGSLSPLGMAVKRHQSDKHLARWELKGWIVEAALHRLGDNQLKAEEQQIVWEACHRPSTINWPSWWTYRV